MSSIQQDAGSTQDMGELLDSFEPMKPLRWGEVIQGIVMRSDADGVLVNIGHKAEGIVPAAEMRTLDRAALEKIKVGDEILAMVIKGESAEGAAILSIDKALGELGWRTLEKSVDSGVVLKGKIIGFNRGGAIVEVEGVQGFVPMSQIISVSREHFKDKPEGAPDTTSSEIGKDLSLKVLEVNRSRNRAILSERQAVQERREEKKAKLIQDLAEGQVRKGRVTGISSFGAFVDLGGADGLIHISELSWNTVSAPDQVVKVGQELEVYVLRVDPDNKKIALSLKRLQPEPWETITQRYNVGDVVDAVITKLTDFGAFARVEGSVEGLVHISELTQKMISHPREVVGEGDNVRLKILRIEPERRRLGLSLKQAVEEQGQV
ncbi:MAG: S1 RNA-binding domain-containing protein [SAR202 cluster bacterium]|nr:S1 RNA-binding domain-containing protein [SAR202 cluster bacterium]